MSETKKCKYCKTEIDKKARICPNCRKKQGGKMKFILIGFVVIIILAAAVNGGSDDTSTDVATSSKTDNTATETSSSDVKAEPTAEPTEKPIEYTKYDVSELMDDLDSNALKAEKKYQDQYVEITGRLSNIDSDGKYINLVPVEDEFAFMGVQCYIKSDEQTDKVMEMTTDDKVTLKGQITSIGEVLGFSLDIDEIK